MADRFWVGDGGNWSDNTNHWSAASGGAPNASKPTSTDNVYFDANSFTTGSQTVTVDEAAYCLDMDWTGVTDNPTLLQTNSIFFNGDVTLAGLTLSGTSPLRFNGAGAQTFSTTVNLSSSLQVEGTGKLTLLSAVTTAYNFLLWKGELDTNNFDVTLGAVGLLSVSTADAKILTLGTTTMNTKGVRYSGSNLTVTANTATIKIAGTGELAGGNVDYNGATFELNGTAHTVSGTATINNLDIVNSATITCSGGWTTTVSGTLTARSSTFVVTGDDSTGLTFAGGGHEYNNVIVEGAGDYALTITGSNTFNAFHVDTSEAAKTLTIDPGSTQTIRKLTTSSTATNVTTIQTGGASATIQGHRGYCELNHVDLTSIVVGEKYRYYAGDNSTDGGGNTNWICTRKVRPWGRFW